MNMWPLWLWVKMIMARSSKITRNTAPGWAGMVEIVLVNKSKNPSHVVLVKVKKSLLRNFTFFVFTYKSLLRNFTFFVLT